MQSDEPTQRPIHRKVSTFSLSSLLSLLYRIVSHAALAALSVNRPHPTPYAALTLFTLHKILHTSVGIRCTLGCTLTCCHGGAKQLHMVLAFMPGCSRTTRLRRASLAHSSRLAAAVIILSYDRRTHPPTQSPAAEKACSTCEASRAGTRSSPIGKLHIIPLSHHCQSDGMGPLSHHTACESRSFSCARHATRPSGKLRWQPMRGRYLSSASRP